MSIPRYSLPTLLSLSLWLWPATAEPASGDDAKSKPRPATRNVVLVTTDGLRWQEVFRGADDALLNKPNGGVQDVEALKRDYWRDTPEARREALMPFLWTTIARQGQIYGNPDKGSVAKVANGKNFSYPGYSEMLTGAPDDRIDSNNKVPNPNMSVLDWLERKPAYSGKVAAIVCWDVFPSILNRDKSSVLINAGWEPIAGESLNDRQTLLNLVQNQTIRIWENCRPDSLTFPIALEHLRRESPRVLYISFGDTDEYAHEGRYDHYLHAAHEVDASLKILWNELQALPNYRDSTTLIVTTDHGRGDAPREWRSHGEKIKGSEFIWAAVLGPDTPALGERSNVPLMTQSQTAATLAAALGEDYVSSKAGIAKPIADAIQPGAGSSAPGAAPAPPKISAEEPLQRIAFGSCATQERPQPIWSAISASKPQLFLFIGDNIYGDTLDMNVLRAKYAKLGAIPGYQAIRNSCPILATWDDHDLGLNDGGDDYPKKDESQKIFLDFFGDPQDSPRRSRPGVYDAHVYGPPGKRVQIIMLDTRYFRSPLKRKADQVRNQGPYEGDDNPDRTMLGADQWRWLEEQLRIPAQIRIIASSVQVVAEDHGWEKWMNFPRERKRLYELLSKTKAEGVILLSGDRHLAELSMMDGGIGYPVYDLTSSGMNQASKSWRPQEVNRHRVATMNWGDNFGFIGIDWDRPDPRIRLQIRDVNGEIRIQERINLSTLRPGAIKGSE